MHSQNSSSSSHSLGGNNSGGSRHYYGNNSSNVYHTHKMGAIHTTRSRDKAEIDLHEHIRKALSISETAPKQKHVRACIVYSWDFQTSQPIWGALRMQPILTDQVVCYKALITIHKILAGGPHVVLGEALGQRGLFENCSRTHGGITLGYGYGPLIQAYVEFLLTKLDFHRTHPEFTGNFDYEEYLSLKGVANLDEGYQTIGELMDLQDRVDRFQKTVFLNVRAMAQNECRIASLVPLVEESYGIYKFITSMLSALHLCVENPEPLIPLVDRYNGQFWALKKFYGECEKIRYLTSLVEIPSLPNEPPSFQDIPKSVTPIPSKKIEPVPPKAESPPAKKVIPVTDDLLGGSLEDNNKSSNRGSHGVEQLSTMTHTITHVPIPIVDDNAMFQAQQQIAMLTEQLQLALQQRAQDQALLGEYHQQVSLLQAQFDDLQKSNTLTFLSEESIIKAKQEAEEWRLKYQQALKEAAKWKAKYEGMAAMYQQLRTEHIDWLAKYNELQKKHSEHVATSTTTTSSSSSSSSIDDHMDMASKLGDRLANEMSKVSAAIDKAANRLTAMKSFGKLGTVHEAVFESATIITTAIGNLIRYAIETQKEIVAMGKESETPEAFYRQHSEWTNGLISAAQAVAFATMTLVETADGVIKGTHSLQHLVAASNALTAATMQLVTASRVKAPKDSRAQPLLEQAAKAVTEANRGLVDSATNAANLDNHKDSKSAEVPEDAFNLKIEELERQARVLALEKELSEARNDLAFLRKSAYQNGNGNNKINTATTAVSISKSSLPSSPKTIMESDIVKICNKVEGSEEKTAATEDILIL